MSENRFKKLSVEEAEKAFKEADDDKIPYSIQQEIISRVIEKDNQKKSLNFLKQKLKYSIDDIGQKEWAMKHGLSASYVCDLYHGRREISEYIAEILGFEKITIYREKKLTHK